MHTITFDDPALRFMGRIDDDNPKAPIWVFPYTQVSFRCTGSHIRVKHATTGITATSFSEPSSTDWK